MSGAYLYGVSENGGTNTFYLSPVPFSEIAQQAKPGPGKPTFGPVEDSMTQAGNLTRMLVTAPLVGVAGALVSAARQGQNTGQMQTRPQGAVHDPKVDAALSGGLLKKLWVTVALLLGFTGMMQLPVASRYGIARIPGLTWTGDFYTTLNIHYALAALLLAGCAAPQAVQAPTPQQTAKAAETQSGVTFTDAMGYPVTVQSWNRVVSLYGSFAEAWTLAGGTLTATTEDAIKERGLDLGTDIAVIGTNQDPNTEEILAQNPDFVILNAEVSEQTALHEFLQEAGVPHAYFKTNTFDEYLAMLRTFCDMTGREDLYEQNGLAVQQQISDVLELVQNAKLPAPNVLLLRAYSSGCKAKGSDNMTGAMLKDLGAINIADADDSLLENLSMENIIADDPEDIFVVTMGASQQKALDWLAENLQANPAWSGLSAVQSGHYYLLDKALFHYKPNARWGESYRTLAALLYPQLADQLEALA